MDRKSNLLTILTAVMTITVFASNIAATKIWHIGNLAIDGGLLIFPVTYVVGDLMVEIYGDRTANRACLLATLINLLMTLFMGAVVLLPGDPDFVEGNAAFASVFGFAFRITAASLTAFILSRVTNNWSFMKIRFLQDQQKFVGEYRVRELLSSLVGRLVDNVIFETIAFLGVLPVERFFWQMGGAYIEGVVVEVGLILTVSGPLVKICRKYVAK